MVVADFSKGLEVYAHIEEELKDIPIGILGKSVKIIPKYLLRNIKRLFDQFDLKFMNIDTADTLGPRVS